jgi:transposase
MGKQAEGNGARRRQRRSFTLEFKAEVVALVRRGERSLPAICRELDLSETAVRRWVAQAAVDAGERDGLTTEEREELRRLRRENKVLREERDILKRAALGSTGQGNAFREDLGRRAKSQRLPGTLIEASGHTVEVAL